MRIEGARLSGQRTGCPGRLGKRRWVARTESVWWPVQRALGCLDTGRRVARTKFDRWPGQRARSGQDRRCRVAITRGAWWSGMRASDNLENCTRSPAPAAPGNRSAPSDPLPPAGRRMAEGASKSLGWGRGPGAPPPGSAGCILEVAIWEVASFGVFNTHPTTIWHPSKS